MILLIQRHRRGRRCVVVVATAVFLEHEWREPGGNFAAHGERGYAVGGQIDVASILLFTALGRLVGGVYYGVPPTACDPFPSIQAVRKTVGGHPAVVAWYDERVAQKKSLESLSPAEQVLAGCRSM